MKARQYEDVHKVTYIVTGKDVPKLTSSNTVEIVVSLRMRKLPQLCLAVKFLSIDNYVVKSIKPFLSLTIVYDDSKRKFVIVFICILLRVKGRGGFFNTVGYLGR